MNKEMRRRICALISSYVVLFGCYFSSCYKDNRVTYNSNYEYNSESPYAFYRNGKIYICNDKIIESIRDDSTNDIYVIDQRNGIDPNLKICNSYEINNPVEMNRILNVLLEYEREYPSNWNRSLTSMRREWLAHNICYYFDVEKYRTAEVDLNNKDENKYLTLIKK